MSLHCWIGGLGVIGLVLTIFVGLLVAFSIAVVGIPKAIWWAVCASWRIVGLPELPRKARTAGRAVVNVLMVLLLCTLVGLAWYGASKSYCKYGSVTKAVGAMK